MNKISFFLILFVINFRVYAALSILLVNDNSSAPDRIEKIKTAIVANGYTYSYYDAVTAQSSPSQELMESFDLVIWYTGNDSADLWFWNGNDTENPAIKGYLENGGMFWLQGLDWLYDKYGDGPAIFDDTNMLNEYFGIYTYYGQSYVDDGGQGVSKLMKATGNDIFSQNSIYWTYNKMWYVDALIGTSESQYLYEMGPPSYVLSGFYPGILNENGATKVISFAFETARINTQSNTNELIGDGLDYFAQFGNGISTYVSSVEVFSPSGVMMIDENEGTLQLDVEILPGDASIPYVFWEVIDESTSAGISQNGLLQANGIADGTVWVKATAMDGSQMADSIQISISNQGNGEFFILLVNDNANTPDRYLSIDSTLTNLGLNYDVFNTVVEGCFPPLPVLSAADLVIWYTGNDGMNLYLWNISNPSLPTFNSPLLQYLDNGGNLWLQGLDFLYDVYGVAPESFESGNVVYDYLGIQQYAVQSKTDDGGSGVPQMDVVDNEICSFSPVQWVWETLYFADGFVLSPNATPIYRMGPSDYVFNEYFSGVYNEKENSKILTFAFETAKINTPQNRDALFNDVLNYFDPLIKVENNKHNTSLFTFYPNPSDGVIYIQGNDEAEMRINIFDMQGKKVFTQTIEDSQSINLHSLDLHDACYLLQAISGQEIEQKILILN
jgi:hypothetical protein